MNHQAAIRQLKFDENKVYFDKISVNLNLTQDQVETFGEWLERNRKAAGLNQTELAARSRVSKNTISLYEADKIDQPRRKQVEKIAKALNRPVDEAIQASTRTIVSKPQNVQEFLAALEKLGIPGIAPFEGLHDLTPEQYEALLHDVRTVIEVNLRRNKR